MPNVKLKKSNIVLRTLTGGSVKVVGKCHVDVNYNGQQVRKLPLYIVDSEGPSLFGRDWLRRTRGMFFR